jgi:hypothetical protein
MARDIDTYLYKQLEKFDLKNFLYRIYKTSLSILFFIYIYNKLKKLNFP